MIEEDIVYNKPSKWVNLSDEQLFKIYENLNYIRNKLLKGEEDKNVQKNIGSQPTH
jgi:hypothetical protein